ncbi:hypothetical protein HCB21_10770 [Listeria booriae]|uniref:ABC-2 transporter permease n=1 Tax=Listeria booriae TaxID=1552123 RepID=UPI001628658D|nr:ABC-2 transporter permease [Listeria booriae]MBC2160256.1 hypothetical protein [Listeria booriae]
MREKGLWYKEWRGIRWMVPCVLLAFLLAFMVGFVNEANSWKENNAHYHSAEFLESQKVDADFAMTDKEIKDDLTVRYLAYETKLAHEDQYTYFFLGFTVGVPFTLTLIFSVVFGACLVILERYTRGDHFTALLPYSKRAIFGVKVLLGVIVITVGYFVSLGLGLLYFTTHVPAEFIDFDLQKLWMDILGSWLAYLILFLVPIVAGYLSGTALGGILLTIGAFLLPSVVLQFSMNVHQHVYDGKTGQLSYWSDYFRVFEPFGFVRPAYVPLVLQVVVLCGLVLIGLWAVVRESLETNGRLFVYPKMRIWMLVIGSSIVGMLVANMIQTFAKLSDSLGFLLFIAIFIVIMGICVWNGARFIFGKRL